MKTKQILERGEKEVKAHFCPECNSFDVKYFFALRNAFGMIPRMRCESCHLEAVGFPLLVTTQKNLEAEVKKLQETKKESKEEKI
jgi:hypothetical protein